jgi:hypothetical protein
VADACPGALDGSFGCFSQQMFELGEDLFDRVEIGAIGRQEEQPCAGSPDRGTNGSALVAAEIIQDDDVAWPKRWDENFFDVETEGLAVDRTVENLRSLGPCRGIFCGGEASWTLKLRK